MESSISEFVNFNNIYDETQTYNIATEFGRTKDQFYLEHAGATLYSEKQISDTFLALKDNVYGNPHAINASSKLSEDIIDQIRYRILAHFNTNPEEYSLIFTSGATAALKLVGENFNYFGENETWRHNAQKQGTFMYLKANHTSVLGMREYAQNVEPISYDEFNNAFKNIQHNSNGNLSETPTNSLFVYPAQCNFSGAKYPLSWIKKIQNGQINKLRKQHENTKWFCMLDTASYASTNKLDLSQIKPDFACISFYKIFGYPCGLGALLVKNTSANVLRKIYFGGGTVQISMSSKKFHVLRNSLHERFEDGTLPFLSIIALQQGFETLSRLNLKMELISRHVFSLARYVHHSLLTMHHMNGEPVAKLYCDSNFENVQTQGGIVNFNLLRDNGDYIGFSEVSHIANLYSIHLRTGCFCNPGACQRHLQLTDEDVQKHFEAGHICGDQHDLVDGTPTGSVRISFGYMSTKADADALLKMISECFIKKPIIYKMPDSWNGLEIKSENLSDIDVKENYLKNVDRTVISNVENITQNIKYTENNFLKVDDTEMKLLKICIYPIKSCGGYTVKNSWELIKTGFQYDRQWMIVTGNGVCLTQKQEVQMCLIKPVINLQEDVMELHFPDLSPIQVPLKIKLPETKNVSLCQSKVCNDRIQGIDCGDEVAAWLENALCRPGLRLLQQCEDGRISKKDSEKSDLSLSNQAQFLLLNTRSVQWLAQQITDADVDLSLDNLVGRFRANLIIETKQPFEELSCSHMKIGDILFKCEGPCTRCQMICIDQETGVKSIEPLRTLSAVSKGKLKFGVYLKTISDTGTKIEIGQNVILI